MVPNLPTDPTMTSAHIRFALTLFQTLYPQRLGQNIVISPLSIGLALAMTANGATGETQRAMLQALAVTSDDLERINQSSRDLLRDLAQVRGTIQMELANALWVQVGYPVRESFLQQVRSSYQAQVANLNFQDPLAPDHINAWVAQHTAGKIGEIVQTLDPLTRLILLNTLYFNGPWQTPFDPNETRDGVFLVVDADLRLTDEKRLPTMRRVGTYHHVGDQTLHAVRLPYADGRLAMEIFMPNRPAEAPAWLQSLDDHAWEQLLSQLQPTEGLQLQLPYITADCSIELQEVLAALGMAVAFDTQAADFSGITEQASGLSIGSVLHRSVLDVRERGTVAAVATKVEMCLLGLSEMPPMIVDRPFFFTIRDTLSGMIVVLGWIVDPEGS